MTIPEAAKQAGISKPAAYKKINHALEVEGLTLADIQDPKTKEILEDRVTWICDLLTRKRLATGKVNQEDTAQINQDLRKQLTAAQEEILQLKEQLQAAREAAAKDQEEIQRLKQHEDLLIQQNAAQTVTINQMTGERLKITAGDPVEDLQTFRQRFRWLITGNKGKKDVK